MRSIKSDVRAAVFAAILLAACHGAVWLIAPALANNSTTPTKPHTFAAGQTILSSQINANFDTAYSELQGNIGTANMLDSSVTSAKIVDLTIVEGDLAAAVTAKFAITGMVTDYIGTSAGSPPTGWVWANGQTIGDASSAATGRANADTEALFLLIYAGMANSEAAVSGGRGASAAADYAAHKTIALPDLRGRSTYGDGDMGSTSDAGRITSSLNVDGTVLGKTAGAATHTNTEAEMFQHSHTATQGTHTHTDSGHVHATTLDGAVSVSGSGVSVRNVLSDGGNGVTLSGQANISTVSAGAITIGNKGSTTPYSTLSPAFITNKIIKLAAPFGYAND